MFWTKCLDTFWLIFLKEKVRGKDQELVLIIKRLWASDLLKDIFIK